MNELLKEYEQMFGEPFPMMAALGLEYEDIIEVLENCLVAGEKYNPDIPEGAVI